MTGSSVWGHLWTTLRLAAALLALAAVAAPADLVIRGAIEGDRHVLTVATNFFGFFTVLSNTLGATVLLWAVVWFWSARRDSAEPPALAFALSAATTYLLITGVAYNIHIPGIPLARAAILPWSSTVLHGVIPAFFALDLLVGPRRRALPWRSVGRILVFPAAWVAYTLARANLVTNTLTGVPYWYPYPFLNPNQPGGYVAVSAYLSVIGLFVLGLAGFVVAVGRWRAGVRRRSPRAQ